MIPILTFEKYSVCVYVCVGTERVGNDIGVVVIMYEILEKKIKLCVCVHTCARAHICTGLRVCRPEDSLRCHHQECCPSPLTQGFSLPIMLSLKSG